MAARPPGCTTILPCCGVALTTPRRRYPASEPSPTGVSRHGQKGRTRRCWRRTGFRDVTLNGASRDAFANVLLLPSQFCFRQFDMRSRHRGGIMRDPGALTGALRKLDWIRTLSKERCPHRGAGRSGEHAHAAEPDRSGRARGVRAAGAGAGAGRIGQLGPVGQLGRKKARDRAGHYPKARRLPQLEQDFLAEGGFTSKFRPEPAAGRAHCERTFLISSFSQMPSTTLPSGAVCLPRPCRLPLRYSP